MAAMMSCQSLPTRTDGAKLAALRSLRQSRLRGQPQLRPLPTPRRIAAAQLATTKKSAAAPGTVVHEDEGGEDLAGLSIGESHAVAASGLEVQLYNTHAEVVYRYLQVFTAICTSFVHRASDVSNAVGPLAAINSVYQTGAVQTASLIPKLVWCLDVAGLVVGLATFGVRLMWLLGEQITVITPNRGFLAESSTASVVSFASGYGIPVSFTRCITGAVVGISMMDVGVLYVR
ncbi:hypothetical protein GH5_05911 [Leishmania sp. Ghana 2012 LV757]|uniref:hypothetical protein n=1 Tax=Leishmania sp. Ghana 2012 LV757 TaxID=2803181 RepID=UPI001B5B0ABB|nr:hypothetical protein GH5_05911 [Leishmania sp. Ghana 2012 LV757]